MAFWVVGGGSGATPLHDHDGHGPDDNIPRVDNDYFHLRRDEPGHHYSEDYSRTGEPEPESVPIRNLAFLVIREGSDDHHRQLSLPSPSPSPSPKPHGPEDRLGQTCLRTTLPIPAPLERTESGLSISSDVSAHHQHNHPHSSADIEQDGTLLGDLEAARFVRDHVAAYRRRSPDSQSERILRALINPKSRGADFQLDNDALRSIFSAANELFFAGRLARRVTWDWSHSASEQYESHVVGTTALRRCAHFGGWETLIVLSSPILRDTKYNRRLLISTFLHEMMHSFMFVTCGLRAKQCGGHTEGFHQIAGIIDDWAGQDCLRLRDMEADLGRWQASDFSDDQQAGMQGTEHLPGLHQQHASWHGHQTHAKHADCRHPAMPLSTDAAPQCEPAAEWQWYEREDFGDRLQYYAQAQHVR